MKTKVRTPFIVDKLPNGNFHVSGFDGMEFTAIELKKLQNLIDSEGGVSMWVF